MNTDLQPGQLTQPDAPTGSDVVRGLSWIGAGHVVSQIAWFGSLLYLAAILPPAAVGSVTIAMVFVQIAWLLQNAGTIGSIIVTPNLTGGQIRYATALTACTGAGTAIVVALFAAPMMSAVGANPADAQILQVLSLSIAVNGLSIVPMALLQKNLHFKRHAAANGGAAVVSSALAVLGGLLGMGVWALVLRQVMFRGFVATFAWAAARNLVRSGGFTAARGRHPLRTGAGKWFFTLSLTSFVALHVDYVIISRKTDAAQLGLYALAFTIAFAPMTQFAWQIGKVLFPSAAATHDAELVRQRALKAMRMVALILLPLAIPAICLAPIGLPGLLGSEWEPMVIAFQILCAVGVVHGLLAIMREFLVATGHVAFCAKTDLVWLVGTFLVLWVMVGADGIRGAALAHLFVLVPLVIAYSTRGAALLGLSAGSLARGLKGVLVPVIVQALTTLMIILSLEHVGVSADVATIVGAMVGLLPLGLMLLRMEESPLREGGAILSGALKGRRVAA